MQQEELIDLLNMQDILLNKAVNHMVDYIRERYPTAYPSKVQTGAVNAYFHSVYADGDGTMSKTNCEHRRIASQAISINAIRLLNRNELDRLQRVLDHIYYMPERICGIHR